MKKYLDNKIEELEILLNKDALSTYGGGMLDAYKDIKKQLTLSDVVGRSEQLVCPNCKGDNTESDTSDIPNWCKDCGAEWAN